MLLRVLHESEYVHFARYTDDSGESVFLASCCKEQKEKPRWYNLSRGSLTAALTALANDNNPEAEPKKRCMRCKKEKRLAHFSADGGRDGGNRYCRECEGKRVKEYTQRQREKVIPFERARPAR